MRKITMIFAMMLCSLSLMAQTKITGTVVDSLTHDAEMYATLRVYKKPDMTKPVAMAVTSDKGVIAMDVKTDGDYLLSVSSVGRKEIRKEFTIKDEATKDLGTLLIQDDSQLLAGVVVVAQKPIVKMTSDKMTYNIAEDTDSKVFSVLDMLRKVPMVTVDAQDNITVNGSSSYKILVDGKPNIQMQQNAKKVLKAMPASMVENIEVITNPGAKYDAEGVGGVLNIQMKRSGSKMMTEMSGYNGAVGVEAGNMGTDVDVFLSGQKRRFSYSIGAWGGYMNMNDVKTENSLSQFTNSGFINSASTLISDQREKYLGAMADIAYEIDSLSTISAAVGIDHFGSKDEGSALASHTDFGYGNSNGYTYDYGKLSRMRGDDINASIDYSHNFNAEKTHTLKASYQFNTSPNRNEDTRTYNSFSGIIVQPYSNTKSSNRTRATEHTAQVDYTLSMGKAGELSMGTKYAFVRNHTNAKMLDLSVSVPMVSGEPTLYTNRQHIAAAYAEHNIELGKWTLREGLRYEHTWEDIAFPNAPSQNFSKNYGNLVPQATVSYTLSDKSNVGLAYNMRINRPTIMQLNPYIDRSDPTQYSYGNSRLSVSKANQVKLTYNYFTPKLMMNLGASYTFSNDDITQYSFSDKANILNTTYSNDAHNRFLNFTVWLRWLAGSNTSLMINGNIGYRDMQSTVLGAHNYGWESAVTAMFEQNLPWGIKWNLGLEATGRTYQLQGRQSGMALAFTTLTKSILDDKLSFALSAFSPLSKHLDTESYVHTANFTNTTKISMPMRMVSFKVTWNFGKSHGGYQKRTSEAGHKHRPTAMKNIDM